MKTWEAESQRRRVFHQQHERNRSKTTRGNIKKGLTGVDPPCNQLARWNQGSLMFCGATYSIILEDFVAPEFSQRLLVTLHRLGCLFFHSPPPPLSFFPHSAVFLPAPPSLFIVPFSSIKLLASLTAGRRCTKCTPNHHLSTIPLSSPPPPPTLPIPLSSTTLLSFFFLHHRQWLAWTDNAQLSLQPSPHLRVVPWLRLR